MLSGAQVETTVLAKGWVKTKRGNKNVAFINLNDGSTIQNIQIVVDFTVLPETTLEQVSTGACIAVSGKLVRSQGAGQSLEINAESIEVLGKADPDKYPLQPKKHSMEFLREIAHLRPRSNTISAVWRIRHAVSFAIHKFFNDKGFFYLHTPIITAADAEGAGEMFRVTTLPPTSPPLNEAGEVDFKEDFFGRPTNLTVSGQLQGEVGALAIGEVYTFGPTFRAENSNTTRHLAEFWMIEPEMAFYDLEDNMNLAEEMLRYLLAYVMQHCADDLAFLNQRAKEESDTRPKEERDEMTLLEKIEFVLNNSFERITYTQAIEILENSTPHKKKKFQFPVQWGIDLQSEHERYLVEKHFKKPVVLTDYPKAIKAFYMKQNEDGKTVRAMDVLFPGIGEIIGGSQREDNLDRLLARVKEQGMSEEELWWYLDLRRFGSAPHSGFGLGLERFLLFVTGMTNIREVIPFPRTPKNADF